MKNVLLIVALFLLLASCGNNIVSDENAIKKDSTDQSVSNNDYMSLAVLYYQNAAETRALYYQGFHLAQLKLEQDIKSSQSGRKAVVLDIDETVLDNSAYEAQCILGHFSYPEKWDEWCNLGIAEPTPGALEFLKFAEKNKYEIFYITNRKAHLSEGTMKNLKDKGFPMADTAHVIFRTAESSKEVRRQKVMENYRIVLLMGDNLADFAMAFDSPLTSQERNATADSLNAEFGSRFIVFPNSMYGDWEMCLYPDPGASAQVKDSIRKAALKGF